MAVAFVQEFKISGDDRSTTNYDAIAGALNLTSSPPAGLIVHSAGWDEEGGVFRIFDVWESREAAERFMSEKLRPLLEQGPANPDNAAQPDREGMYELHDVATG
jgi:hypothetical protein